MEVERETGDAQRNENVGQDRVADISHQNDIQSAYSLFSRHS